MLDELEPRQFDEWLAYHDLEPFGDDWRRTGAGFADLHNQLLILRNLQGGEVEEEEWLDPEAFVPKPIDDEEDDGDELTPEEIVQFMHEWQEAFK